MTNPTLTYRPLPGARLNMAHPIAKDMALCMLLNENGGSRAMDISPYNANGALVGFGSPAKRPFNGLQFVAATPSYIEIPAAFTQLNFTSQNFSIIARIKLDALVTDRYIFDRAGYNIDGYRLVIVSTGALYFATYQTPGIQISSSSAGSIVIDTWYTVGLSRAGASARVFRNGVDITTTAGTHINPLTCARKTAIGIQTNLVSNPLDGKIEFLYVWGRRALTASEHKAIHISPYNPYGSEMFI